MLLLALYAPEKRPRGHRLALAASVVTLGGLFSGIVFVNFTNTPALFCMLAQQPWRKKKTLLASLTSLDIVTRDWLHGK